MFTSMISLTALGSLLFSGISARPTVSASMISITDLHLRYVENGTSTIVFNAQTDGAYGNRTTSCSKTWLQPNPADLALFTSNGYTASFDGWEAYNNFRLHFSHSYEDPSVGEPDWLTVYANADITEPSIICLSSSTSNGVAQSCTQPSGTVIKAPITSMIAKN